MKKKETPNPKQLTIIKLKLRKKLKLKSKKLRKSKKKMTLKPLKTKIMKIRLKLLNHLMNKIRQLQLLRLISKKRKQKKRKRKLVQHHHLQRNQPEHDLHPQSLIIVRHLKLPPDLIGEIKARHAQKDDQRGIDETFTVNFFSHGMRVF